jgi:Uma2 family endonuclease
MATVTETLLTAEQYAQLPDNGRPSELVRGRVVEMNPPFPRHGQICSTVTLVLGSFAREHNLGHIIGNDSAVLTERDPDTVRGADVAYYSYAKVPKGPVPRGYLAVMPDLVFEVLSPDDRWKKVQIKVAEYLEAGVPVVCVLDEEPPTVYLYSADRPVRILNADDELAFPDLLPGFAVKVRRFFE